MAEAAAKEPTMEDILASIRKIISQEDGKPLAAPPVDAGAVARTSAPQPVAAQPAPMTHAASQPATPSTAPQAQPRPQPSGQSLASIAAQKLGIAQPVVQPSAQPIAQPQPAMAAQPLPQPRPQPSVSLSQLASQVKAQMPHPANPAQPPATPQQPVAARQAMLERSIASPQPYVQPSATSAQAAQVQTAQPQPTQQEVSAFRDALVSPSTVQKVDQSIDRLRSAVADNTSAKVEAVLRPMLREWLDQNLPGMVERIVREEISKIAKG